MNFKRRFLFKNKKLLAVMRAAIRRDIFIISIAKLDQWKIFESRFAKVNPPCGRR